jgi:hypothetical protein
LDIKGEKRDDWKKWTKREMYERTYQWTWRELDERTIGQRGEMNERAQHWT